MGESVIGEEDDSGTTTNGWVWESTDVSEGSKSQKFKEARTVIRLKPFNREYVGAFVTLYFSIIPKSQLTKGPPLKGGHSPNKVQPSTDLSLREPLDH